MAESQAPAKDRPKPHLGMYPVHRMLYAQKGKDTQKDRTHRPDPQSHMENLFHGNILHAKHRKGQKQNTPLMRIPVHDSHKQHQKRLHHPLSSRIRRNRQLDGSQKKSRNHQQLEKLLPFVKPQPLGDGQKDKKAEITRLLPGHLYAVL